MRPSGGAGQRGEPPLSHTDSQGNTVERISGLRGSKGGSPPCTGRNRRDAGIVFTDFKHKMPPKTPKNRRLATFLHSQRSTTPLASAEKVEKSTENKKKGNLFSQKSSLGSHLVAIQKLPFLPLLRPQWFPRFFGSHLVATL